MDNHRPKEILYVSRLHHLCLTLHVVADPRQQPSYIEHELLARRELRVEEDVAQLGNGLLGHLAVGLVHVGEVAEAAGDLDEDLCLLADSDRSVLLHNFLNRYGQQLDQLAVDCFLLDLLVRLREALESTCRIKQKVIDFVVVLNFLSRHSLRKLLPEQLVCVRRQETPRNYH